MSYPLVKIHKPTERKITRPNIFVILMESFNANYVETKNNQGIEYTPFFNSMIDKSLYVENFYANSIQTCKGHIAVFASVIPSFRGKIYRDYEDINILTLQDILRDNGYKTIFMQAAEDINFDNTYKFLIKNGFDIVSSIFPYLSPDDSDELIPWGVHDHVFYKRFFEFLDQYKQKEDSKDKPVFAALATITNHMNFNFLPKDRMKIYKNARHKKEHYANTLYLSDLYLKEFFKQLKKRPELEDSLVIILGDHSYPMGEKGIYHTEISAYEESFKTPFLMYWPGKIEPQRLTGPYSQMDIAPSLLDLLGLEVKRHHFTGVSLFSEFGDPHPIYLIQPYNGRFISIVRYPYKYITNLRTRRELVYDIENDPGETDNILNRLVNEKPEIYDAFRKDLEFVFLNQVLLENNEVWKTEQTED